VRNDFRPRSVPPEKVGPSYPRPPEPKLLTSKRSMPHRLWERVRIDTEEVTQLNEPGHRRPGDVRSG